MAESKRESQPSRFSGSELAYADGQTVEAIRLLGQGLNFRSTWGAGPFFLGAESLATLLEREEKLLEAVQVLEEWSSEPAKPAGHLRAARWERLPEYKPTDRSTGCGCRWKLAQLYRNVGRGAAAAVIESELRDLLAYADADHFIARELQSQPSSFVE